MTHEEDDLMDWYQFCNISGETLPGPYGGGSAALPGKASKGQRRSLRIAKL
jgi:hypothetical protein